MVIRANGIDFEHLNANRDTVKEVQKAGYYGFSMSNNAVEAYDSGEMPISKWTSIF